METATWNTRNLRRRIRRGKCSTCVEHFLTVQWRFLLIDDLISQQILTHIVDLLPYTDLKSARLVCKKLYRACESAKFVERERVVFYENSYVSICNPRVLLRSERVFRHFKFEVLLSLTLVWLRLAAAWPRCCFWAVPSGAD